MVLAVKQYDKDGWCSQEVTSFKKVPYNVVSVPADIFAYFRVKPDTYRLTVELYKDYWNMTGEGLLCRMDVPFCNTDFFRHYKRQPVLYVLITFIGERMIFDFLHGVRPQLHKKPSNLIVKVGDSQPCQIFHREDMPLEARQLCDFVPLDTIDIW